MGLHARTMRAEAIAARAARILGHADGIGFALADRDHRVLPPDESVADGESYALVMQSRRLGTLS